MTTHSVSQNACRTTDTDRIERMTRTCLLAALALLLGFVETMIALPLAIPGIKLGLSNVAILVALYAIDGRNAAAVAFVKVIAAGFLFGSPMMLAYSAAGTLLAFIAMLALHSCRKISVVTVSVAAAVMHNLGQLLVAAWFLDTWAVMLSFPVLAICACATGLATGFIAAGVLPAARLCALPCPDAAEFDEFTPQAGTLYAFIGANGSGKTAFAIHLANNSRKTAHLACRTSIAFQNPDDQIVAAVVQDDVAFGLENRNVDRDTMQASVRKALSDVGLAERHSAIVSELSGGQKQAVAVAGLEVLDPQVLLFDETSAMMDACARRRLMEYLRSLCRQKKAVVFITQFMDEAFEADAIVIFKDGRIVGKGSPEEFLADPHTPDTLHALGLELPQTARISLALQRCGIAVPTTCDADRLKEAIWRLYAAT